MAIKSKTQLLADISGSTLAANNKAILSDMVESYEDYISNLTSVQIAAIASPIQGQKVFNVDFTQLQIWTGSQWTSQLPVGTPITTTVTITSAQILSANTTPISLIPAAGVGLAIIPQSVLYKTLSGTTPYATNTSASLFHDTKSVDTQYLVQFSFGVNTDISAIVPQGSGQSLNSVATNKDLMFGVKTGNPRAGDSDLQLTITYVIMPI